MAGLDLLRTGQRQPIGTLTQTVDQSPVNSPHQSLAQKLGLTELTQVRFAFDLIETNAYEAATNARSALCRGLGTIQDFSARIEAKPGIANRYTPTLNEAIALRP